MFVLCVFVKCYVPCSGQAAGWALAALCLVNMLLIIVGVGHYVWSSVFMVFLFVPGSLDILRWYQNSSSCWCILLELVLSFLGKGVCELFFCFEDMLCKLTTRQSLSQ